jgi:thiol:disulfide interchange protein DsbD
MSNTDMVLGWGIFTRDALLLSWSALALAGAAYLARCARARIQRRDLGLETVIGIAAALFLAGWLASGLNERRRLDQIEAFLPPVSPMGPLASSGLGASTWMLNDYEGALNAARSTGKLVFVDFTGYTCTNCRWMEANIFSRPDVGAELGQFVLSRLYTDGDGEIYERQQAFQEKTFGTVALPLYAVMAPDGKVRATFSGLSRNPAEFIAFLKTARERRVASR